MLYSRKLTEHCKPAIMKKINKNIIYIKNKVLSIADVLLFKKLRLPLSADYNFTVGRMRKARMFFEDLELYFKKKLLFQSLIKINV